MFDNCSCSDDENGYIFSARICIARHEHFCSECKYKILPGQWMEMIVFCIQREKGSGGIKKRCGFCANLGEALDCCVPYGWMSAVLEDEFNSHSLTEIKTFFGCCLASEIMRRFNI